jgi:hypothetical protein
MAAWYISMNGIPQAVFHTLKLVTGMLMDIPNTVGSSSTGCTASGTHSSTAWTHSKGGQAKPSMQGIHSHMPDVVGSELVHGF